MCLTRRAHEAGDRTDAVVFGGQETVGTDPCLSWMVSTRSSRTLSSSAGPITHDGSSITLRADTHGLRSETARWPLVVA